MYPLLINRGHDLVGVSPKIIVCHWIIALVNNLTTFTLTHETF